MIQSVAKYSKLRSKLALAETKIIRMVTQLLLQKQSTFKFELEKSHTLRKQKSQSTSKT